MSFEETELRLGLPGNNNGKSEMTRKRGFDHEQHEYSATDQTLLTMPHLKLDLVSSHHPNHNPPSPKGEVVGWPPIRSYRKKRLSLQKGSKEEESDEEKKVVNKVRFVKVSLDGAPYLRKVDLNIYNSYTQLSHALAKFFAAFTIGNCGSQAAGMNESKLIDFLNGSDYVPTYQDKDGDWMLVGDVPWEMFVESCKRVRIMKGKEAIGLAPRAVEKCKNYKN
ncbi:auxin-induced protein AUX28-like [Benincasa hispida]|uniref:auxin-induced protein AUX28-like n=1 Tax=Benincasa hispida TaxID=102211 RepID=UPI0018FF6F15|nr:auxin-induced protein AUX28-like [Benincasa hispida]